MRSRWVTGIVVAAAVLMQAQSPWVTAQTSNPPAPSTSPTPTVGAPWIVYQAPFGDTVDLGVVRINGMDAHEVPGGPGNRWHPAWSPDGQWIAYDWNVPSNVSEIAMLRLDGSEERTLLTCDGPCYGNGGPAFSPDGTAVGFDGAEGPTPQHQGDLCYLGRLELNSGTVTHILEHPGCEVSDSYLRFAPDGGRVVFQRDGPTGKSLFTVRTDGTDEVRVTEDGVGSRADWSPDGEHIVLMERDSCECPDEVTLRVEVVRPDGTDLHPITNPATGSFDAYPRWLPDGSGILYSHCTVAGACEMHVVQADGTGDRILPVPPGPDVVHLDQQPVPAATPGPSGAG
jgi:Tol biopolymer transport system component